MKMIGPFFDPTAGIRWRVFAALLLVLALVIGIVTVAPLSHDLKKSDVIGDSFFLKVLFIVLYMVGAVSALLGAGLIFKR